MRAELLRSSYVCLLLQGSLLLSGDRLLGPLACARVRVRALPPNGEAPAVADALVATDLDLTFDVLRDFTAEISFDLVVLIDVGADLQHLVLGKVSDLRGGLDTG